MFGRRFDWELYTTQKHETVGRIEDVTLPPTDKPEAAVLAIIKVAEQEWKTPEQRLNGLRNWLAQEMMELYMTKKMYQAKQ